MSHSMAQLALQLAVILLAARFFGWFFSRKLRQPVVLGEMISGILIGPYVLGALPVFFLNGPLFPLPGGQIPVSSELYGIAVLGSIILLFVSGLETDVKTFLRFSGQGIAVGIGGIILPFLLGSAAAVLLLPGVHAVTDPTALFLGVISTATSVGITARILSEHRKVSSPEGVTILSAAVFDDVLSMVLLAVAVGITQAVSEGGEFPWRDAGVVGLKALGFWVVFTAVGILLAPLITRGMKRFESLGMTAAVSFGIALLLAGLAEFSGLAMIIGAYITGLSFSQTDVANEIRERLQGIYDFLVPVFFCVMGMMVDIYSIAELWGFALIFALLAVAGKLIGSGLPAFLVGFNLKGAIRIGSGMLPRGEVTLIIASAGLAAGAIGNDVFGVAVMTMLIASILAPPMIKGSFLKGGTGYLREKQKEEAASMSIELSFPSERTAEFFTQELLKAFREEGFFTHRPDHYRDLYTIRKEHIALSMSREETDITIHTREDHEPFVRLLITEELLKLKDFLTGLETMKSPDMMGAELVMGMFQAFQDEEQNSEETKSKEESCTEEEQQSQEEICTEEENEGSEKNSSNSG